MSLQQARGLLHSRRSLLHPFVIILGDEKPRLIYGDIQTMSNRMDLILTPLGHYHTLRFPGRPSLAGFLYVWYYLNGLDEDQSLFTMMEFESYVIPVPGSRSVSIRPQSLITPTPIEAFYYLRAFGISFTEHIWGKWFLGLFPLDKSKDKMNREILGYTLPHLPQYFIPPPIIRSTEKAVVPIRTNRFDDDIIRLFPTAVPPSFIPRLGRLVSMEELQDKYINRRSLRELLAMRRTAGGSFHTFEEQLICVVGKSQMLRLDGYYIETRVEIEGLEGLTRDHFRIVLAAYPDIKSEYVEIHREYRGWWVGTSLESFGVMYLPGRVPAEIYVAADMDKNLLDTIVEENFYPEEYSPIVFTSYAVAFTIGDKKERYHGNPVVMASRSPLIMRLMEGELGREIHLGESFPTDRWFPVLWKWLNNIPMKPIELHMIEVTGPLWTWLNYFQVAFDSSFFTSISRWEYISLRGETIMLEQARDDRYKRIRLYNPIIPSSREKAMISLTLDTLREIPRWVPPYKGSVSIPFSEVRPGDLAVVSDVIYRIQQTGYPLILDAPGEERNRLTRITDVEYFLSNPSEERGIWVNVYFLRMP